MIAQDLLPSHADVAFYEDHGWWISPKLFSDERIDQAYESAGRYYAGSRDSELPAPIKRYLNWTPEQADRRLSKDDYVLQQSQALGAVGLAPVIGAIAARLARTEQVRLFSSSLIHKPPLAEGDAARVGWHVDRAYWQTCTSEKMLTAWIPLHDCYAEMGTITMIDRSHRWPSSPAVEALRRATTFISEDVAAVEHRLEEVGLAIEKVPMSLRKGQVSFHNCRTFHGSDVNRSSSPRICLTVHLQDEGNTYRPAQKPNGEPIVHNTDLLVRRLPSGEPDYRDDMICPVIWHAGMGLDPDGRGTGR
jgi:ectoine hydroxylase-related dioxygenase (phytanoyl-CoA dioxygenase family)